MKHNPTSNSGTWGFVLLVAMLGMEAAGVTNLSYVAGFESGLGSEWVNSTPSSISARVTSPVIEGSYACKVMSNDYTLAIDQTGSTYTNIWVQIYSFPEPYDDYGGYPSISNASFAFYVNTDGKLMAYASNTWVEVAANLDTNKWFGFTVHIDYKSSNYALYVANAGLFGASMVRATNIALNFSTNYRCAKLSNVVVSTTAAGYVDAIAITTGLVTESVAGGVEPASNVWPVLRAANRTATVPLPPYQYGAGGTLGGQLGTDLKKGLKNGDTVQFLQSGAGGAMRSSSLNSGSWQGAFTGVVISNGTALTLRRVTSGDEYAFYPYNTGPTNVQQTIYASNDTVTAGWALLCWPMSRAAAGQASWFTSGRGAGDRIWTYDATTATYTVYRFDGSNWIKLGETSATTALLQPGQAFWYQRKAVTPFDWLP